VGEGRARELALRVEPQVRYITMLDTVYRRDTIRLWRTIAQYDSVRMTDTIAVTRAETTVVYIPRAVADDAIVRCTSAVLLCEKRVAARDTLINTLQTQLKLVGDSKPGVFKVWSERVLWGAAGYGLGVAASRR